MPSLTVDNQTGRHSLKNSVKLVLPCARQCKRVPVSAQAEGMISKHLAFWATCQMLAQPAAVVQMALASALSAGARTPRLVCFKSYSRRPVPPLPSSRRQPLKQWGAARRDCEYLKGMEGCSKSTQRVSECTLRGRTFFLYMKVGIERFACNAPRIYLYSRLLGNWGDENC